MGSSHPYGASSSDYEAPQKRPVTILTIIAKDPTVKEVITDFFLSSTDDSTDARCPPCAGLHAPCMRSRRLITSENYGTLTILKPYEYDIKLARNNHGWLDLFQNSEMSCYLQTRNRHEDNGYTIWRKDGAIRAAEVRTASGKCLTRSTLHLYPLEIRAASHALPQPLHLFSRQPPANREDVSAVSAATFHALTAAVLFRPLGWQERLLVQAYQPA
ncbi:unnamed protein product [Heligmosomoides polygyrus]|uniref:PAS_3 domain-containing protein n=1 Tax=Heligmosomoides polygyrus TaxID=6339 RepID=A0A183GG28_HELPZ|nr:unnamed protein product [Heligmosomoides polygyrus]